VVEAVISVTDLRKSYKKVRAVNGVSLEVRGGEAYGLLGPNGSGKSTTLHALVGIVRPTGGTATICGFDSRSVEAKSLLGFVPDDLGMPETLSGGEFLDFVRTLYGVGDRSRAEILTKVLGLEGALARQVDRGVLPRHEEKASGGGCPPARAKSPRARRTVRGPRP
jgi:ABC-type multidrug transport system ATPase subunit